MMDSDKGSQPKQTWAAWLSDNELTELIELPVAVAEQDWCPREQDRLAAWALYTEMRSRISTQALHYRAGDEETALQSLYQLFAFSREILKQQGPQCRHFATLAVLVLNGHIRPFTARWHKRQVDQRFIHDDERRQFRAELQGLQKKLRLFARFLGLLAEGENFRDGSETGLADAADAGRPAEERWGETIVFDRMLFEPAPANYKDILAEEQFAISERRKRAGTHDAGDDKVENLAGLACSGGGIRSATFCLGVTQRLAKQGLLPYIDYLSTVSGGGYFGAFLSSYWNDKDPAVGARKDQLPFARLSDQAESDPIRHLRNNSKYFLKGGLPGQARILGLLLYGVLVNLLVLLPVLVIVLLIAKIAQSLGMDYQLWRDSIYSTVGVLLIGLLLLILVLPLMHRYCASETLKRYCEKAGIWIMLIIAGLALLGLFVPWAYYALSAGQSWQTVLLVAGATPFVLAALAFLLGTGRLWGRLLMVLVGVAGPLLLMVVFLILLDRPLDWSVLAGAGVIALIYGWLIDINLVSLHRYYRNRLAETYLIRRRANGGESATEYVDSQKLSELRSLNPTAPYHLINAALNIPYSKRPGLRGRRSDFFLFSERFCGSPVLGYCPTKTIEQCYPALDLGTAMAISGAAASSYMGTLSFSGASFWMALLNFRLGYWVPNPGRIDNPKRWWGPGPLYLLSELSGMLSEKTRYVNVSDGGHIENLGIYELLRRRCKYIIAIDGEADPLMRFGGLITAIRFAQIDLGVRIRIDLGDLIRQAHGNSRAHFALGTIEYNDRQRGLLLYIKSSLTGNERDYIQDYKNRNPSFPHQSTGDQFFDEAQFEAYRALGYHIGGDLFREELLGTLREPTLERWFSALAESLLEPASEYLRRSETL